MEKEVLKKDKEPKKVYKVVVKANEEAWKTCEEGGKADTDTPSRKELHEKLLKICPSPSSISASNKRGDDDWLYREIRTGGPTCELEGYRGRRQAS